MEPMANIALRAARLAGKHIMRGFDRPDLVKVSEKDGGSLVTNIDREAEQIIAETLSDKYPGHKITGEESEPEGSAQGDAEYEWVVDPIDGTMNFIRQIPHFCVSIGCLRNGRLEHGVVFDPARQEEFVASRGQGAQLNGKRMRVSDLQSLDRAVVASGGLARRTRLDGEMAVIRDVIEQRSFTRQQGSAALELAYVAAGRLDALWMHGLSPWDLAAGVLLVTEAGGLVGDFAGGGGYMKSGDVVAGSPRCFKQLANIVRKRLG